MSPITTFSAAACALAIEQHASKAAARICVLRPFIVEIPLIRFLFQLRQLCCAANADFASLALRSEAGLVRRQTNDSDRNPEAVRAIGLDLFSLMLKN
jgi:hypothetical protein